MVWADRRIGELSAELPKAPDGKRRGSESVHPTQKKDALASLGLTKQQASEAEKVARLPDVRAYPAAA